MRMDRQTWVNGGWVRGLAYGWTAEMNSRWTGRCTRMDGWMEGRRWADGGTDGGRLSKQMGRQTKGVDVWVDTCRKTDGQTGQ